MKVLMLYRSGLDSRQVEDFAHDLERQHQTKVELVSVDTREGSATARLYDIMQYPAILVTRDDGQLVKDWQGSSLPLKDEVAHYTHM